MTDERSITSVPLAIALLLMLAIAAQITLRNLLPVPIMQTEALPDPPRASVLRILSLGDEPLAAKLVMLWLQSFDNQPGVSLPLASLDYTTVIAWLRLALELDTSAQYPLLSAARIYTEVPDSAKQRQMLEFVEQEFLIDPNRRWPWVAHAVYVAKHRLKDPDLALRFANSLADNATGPGVPHWAQQMVIFVLEEMGELESAKVLLGGLLESGQISDPHEQWFLSQRLAELEASAASAPTD